MDSRQCSKFVPILALLSGMLITMHCPRVTLAQPSAQAWSPPAWVLPPQDVRNYFRLEYLRDKNSLKSANPGGDQTRQIKRIVQAFLSQLTQEDPGNLPKTVVDRLLADLHFPSTTVAAKGVAMEELVKLIPDLMQHPNDLVRYNALSILVQMSLKQAQSQGGNEIPAVPYNPAHRVFLQVVQDPNQNLSCRILAARGLQRICRDGENAPSSNEKSDIATVLVSTLAANPPSSEDGHWWFRLRLIEALGAVDRIDNTATQPIVLEALLDVITDPKEVWLNRSMAAQCISQLPYSSSTNVQLITSEILQLLAEMSDAFNKNPSSLEMREPFKRVYLSFRPATAKLARERKWGLLYEIERPGLSGNANYVKGGWLVAFPILKRFMETNVSPNEPVAPISAAELAALRSWLQQNPPASRQIVPGGKTYPLRESEAATAVGANSN